MKVVWKEEKLGDFGDFLNGVNFNRGAMGHGYKLINVKDLYNNILIDFNNLDEVNLDDKKKIDSYLVKRGDLFFSRSSVKRDGVGIVCMSPIDSSNAVHCGFIIRYRINDRNINPLFLTYLLRSPEYRKKIINLSGGVAIININQETLGNLKVLLPKIEVQNKISSILFNYDNLIENNEKRIKLLEQIAKMIYEEWFVNFKFPGHKNMKMVDTKTDFGKIPEGWEVGNMGCMYKLQPGFAFKSKDFCDSGYDIIRIKNINEEGSINIDNCERIPEDVAERAEKFKLNSGDILIAMTGATIGKIGIMPRTNSFYYLNQRVGRFLPIENDLGVGYAYFITKSKQFRKLIENISLGAAQPNISGSYIENIKILIPKKEILLDFSNIINNYLKIIEILRSKNQNLRKTRDFLLPKLISGEIDISNLDIKIPEIEA